MSAGDGAVVPDPRGQAIHEAGGVREPLLAGSETETFQSRWRDVQARFVDEPQRSVEEADALVAEVMQRVQETFADERARLERLWERGDDASTEDLRVAVTRYRSFFERLLDA